MKNEEILEIVKYLFNHTFSWDKLQIEIYNDKDQLRSGLKYKDELTIRQMGDMGIFSDVSYKREPVWLLSYENVTNLVSYQCFTVTYKKIDLLQYLISNIDFEVGKIQIKKNGDIFVNDKKKKNIFKADTQPRQFIAYLAICKKVSYDDFGRLFDVYVDKDILNINERKKIIKDGVKKIKDDVVVELKKYGLSKTYIDKLIVSITNWGYKLTV